jgi:beta-glucosidase
VRGLRIAEWRRRAGRAAALAARAVRIAVRGRRAGRAAAAALAALAVRIAVRGRRAGRAAVAALAAAGVLAVAAWPAGSDAQSGPAVAGPCSSAPTFPLEPYAQAQAQAQAMVARMTLAQEQTLLHGVGQGAPSGAAAATAAIPSLGIPALNQQDGPAGVADAATGVTQLPAPEALAATFDPALATCYGQVIGQEERGKGIDLVYGPTVNIVRQARWGRTYEALGEDPELDGTMAAAEVNGIQSTGEMAEVKHYAVYNQETYRNTSLDDAIVSQKALHEIYLRPWQLILAQSSPAAVMCSYSTINGVGACENRALLDGELDTTLGFQGFVSSDWGATHAAGAAIDAGLDQEEPFYAARTGAQFDQWFGGPLAAAVAAGRVSQATVAQAAVRVLTQMYRFGLLTAPPSGTIATDVATAPDAAVATSVAQDGTVLLANRGRLLPLTAATRSIAVVGPAASLDPVDAGNGSARVIAQTSVTPLAGITALAGPDRKVSYSAGLPVSTTLAAVPASALTPALPAAGVGTGGYTGTLRVTQSGTYVFAYGNPVGDSPTTLTIDGQPLLANPGTQAPSTYSLAIDLRAGRAYRFRLSGPANDLRWATPATLAGYIAAAARAAAKTSVAVVVVADGTESEAADRVSLELPGDQDALISAVAAANPRTVVVIDAGAPVLMPWLRSVPAVLDAWYPGQGDGSSLAALLFGRADPSGHLPVTFPASESAVPASTPRQFPGVDGEVHYSEGVDVGYRWYDAHDVTPLFPFGYGLSYTSFAFSDLRVHADGTRVSVSAQVRNSGRRSGADAVQLYLGLPAAADDPPRQLEAFARVSLAPGAQTTVHFTLSPEQLSYWGRGAERVAPGRYAVYLGDSSALAQLPLRASFEVR